MRLGGVPAFEGLLRRLDGRRCAFASGDEAPVADRDVLQYVGVGSLRRDDGALFRLGGDGVWTARPPEAVDTLRGNVWLSPGTTVPLLAVNLAWLSGTGFCPTYILFMYDFGRPEP